jgi:hypothetical protein
MEFSSKMAKCGNNSLRAKNESNEKIIEQVSEFKYFGSVISSDNTDRNLEYRIKTFNKMKVGIRRSFGKKLTKEAPIRLHKLRAQQP